MIFCENSVLNESISLAPKNADVSELNKEILQKINGPTLINGIWVIPCQICIDVFFL